MNKYISKGNYKEAWRNFVQIGKGYGWVILPFLGLYEYCPL